MIGYIFFCLLYEKVWCNFGPSDFPGSPGSLPWLGSISPLGGTLAPLGGAFLPWLPIQNTSESNFLSIRQDLFHHSFVFAKNSMICNEYLFKWRILPVGNVRGTEVFLPSRFEIFPFWSRCNFLPPPFSIFSSPTRAGQGWPYSGGGFCITGTCSRDPSQCK